MRPSLPRSVSLLFLLSLGVLGAAGCPSGPAAGDVAPTAELRTYAVPPGYTGDVRTALRQAFGDDGVGRVAMGPSGQLVVVAPAAVHRGIAEFVEQLAALPQPPAEPNPVTLDYWLVVGVDPDARIADDTARLAPVADALDRIVREEGPQRFELVEHLRLSSVGEDWAQITGRVVTAQQRATLAQGVVVAELQVGMRQHRLQTQVKLDPGQIVVLAESGLEPRSTLYYLITASTD
jgi:hypothetical protein